MVFTYHPDRLSADAFSDTNLKTINRSGLYSRFTNTLLQPITNVKGLQLLRANFVNSALQLNDNNGQLFFLYYRYSDGTSSGIALTNMHCVRLHTSNFVPYAGYTAYTRNKYFNNVTELVNALNAAASTGGDSVTFNPTWIAGDITFTYDTTTRKITFTGNNSGYYSPVAFDDPNVALFFANNASYTPKMNAFNSANSYASATYQAWINGDTMNPRLGFGLAYNNRGLWFGSASVVGCASSTQVPQANGTGIEADSYPILIGAQNLNIYCSILGSSGQSSSGRKNLLACIPLEYEPLNVCSYTLTSVEGRELSVAGEIYELSFDFTDDFGNPFYFYPNMNTQLEMNIFYDKPSVGDYKEYFPEKKMFLPLR